MPIANSGEAEETCFRNESKLFWNSENHLLNTSHLPKRINIQLHYLIFGGSPIFQFFVYTRQLKMFLQNQQEHFVHMIKCCEIESLNLSFDDTWLIQHTLTFFVLLTFWCLLKSFIFVAYFSLSLIFLKSYCDVSNFENNYVN